jgi:phenylalanyl-tRNA synthetase beta subunit
LVKKILVIKHEKNYFLFLNLGLNELIHYSLVNEKTFLNNEIKLINPLLSDCSNLRSSLLPNLIKTIQENLKQGNSFIEGFEYGHVFSGELEIIFKKKNMLLEYLVV